MGENENQHTVARFHLRRFTPDIGDKILWQYSKTDPQRPRRVSPRDAASESYFYSYQRKDGSWDHCLELALAKAEDLTAPALRRLTENDPLQRGDRQLVAQYIGLMMMRTKGPRDTALSTQVRLESPELGIEYVQQNWDVLCKRHGEPEMRIFLANAREKGTGMILPRNYHLDNVFERADQFGARIIQMRWTILNVAPPLFFCLSDNPAFARYPRWPLSPEISAVERDDLGVELGFPLSSRSFLVASWGAADFLVRQGCSATRAMVLNTRTVLSATEHVFSPERSTLIQDLVSQYRDFQIMYPRFTHQELLAALKE